MTQTASSETAGPRAAADARERDARRRYLAAIAAAYESLRRAAALFGERSASIDAHIERARALDPVATRLLQGPLSSISPRAETAPTRVTTPSPTLSPEPLRLPA